MTNLNNNARSPWWRDPGLRSLNLRLTLIFCAAASVGYDASLVNGLLIIPSFMPNLEPIKAILIGLLFGGLPLGAILCYSIASWVSDMYGRRVVVAMGAFIMLVTSIAQALTHGPWVFFGTRILLGAGLAFTTIGAAPLATELAHPRQRVQISNLYQTVWYCGSIISAIITLGCLYMTGDWAWRLPCLLQLVFPGLQLLGAYLAPESPRYLISKGRVEEARRILARYHANGDEEDELVRFQVEQISLVIEEEKHLANDTGYLEFFQTPGNRHRLFICLFVGFSSQWVGNGLLSYYLSPTLTAVGITSALAQSGINLGLQAWNCLFAFVGAMLVTRFGRRPLWLTSAIGMTVSFVAVIALSARYQIGQGHDHALGIVFVVFAFIFFAFYDIGYTPLSIAYPIEIVNYRLRTKGFSITLMSTFAAGFFNIFVNPIAIEAIEWKLYLVYLGVLVVTVAVIFFTFPETKGRTLEEIGEIFDGPMESIAISAAGLSHDKKLGESVTYVDDKDA